MTFRKSLAGGQTPPPPQSDSRYASLKQLRNWLILELSSVNNLINDWEKEYEFDDLDLLTVRDLDNHIADITIGLGEAIEDFYETNKDNPFLKGR